jgi:hypothetical protein
MTIDKAYLLKREIEESAAATRAHGKARAAHEEMARLYRERADAAEPREAPIQSAAAPAQVE